MTAHSKKVTAEEGHSEQEKITVEIPADRTALSVLGSRGVTPRFIKRGKKLVYDEDVDAIWNPDDRTQTAYRKSRWRAERVARALIRIDRLDALLKPQSEKLWDAAAKQGWIALAVPMVDWNCYPLLGPSANWMALKFDKGTTPTPDGDVRAASYGDWYGPPIPGKFEGKPAKKPSAARWALGNRWLLKDYKYGRLRRARKLFELLHDRLARPTGVPPALNTTRRVEIVSKDGRGSVVSWWQVQAVPLYHSLPVDRRREWVRIVPLEIINSVSEQK